MLITYFAVNLRQIVRRNVFKTTSYQPLFKRFISGNDAEIDLDEKDERYIYYVSYFHVISI